MVVNSPVLLLKFLRILTCITDEFRVAVIGMLEVVSSTVCCKRVMCVSVSSIILMGMISYTSVACRIEHLQRNNDQ